MVQETGEFSSVQSRDLQYLIMREGDMNKFDEVLDFIKTLYPGENPVPLHAPRFLGNEKKYLAECVDTTYVSYVGKFVTDFEEHIKRLTGSTYAAAFVNGTTALQIALIAAGVKPGDEVITQALTFAATAAGICHAQAEPIFIDVDENTLGMNPDALARFLDVYAESRGGVVINKKTGKRIAAVVPMHTFGHPVRIEDISEICKKYGITLIEDAAESLGSCYKNRHTGTFGAAAILSFNGNKPVTTGGGGMIISNDEALIEKARHLSTTAKKKHPWEFFHDEIGYNFRMPNVNAALGCAQMEYFDKILTNKRATADMYRNFFRGTGIEFFNEPENSQSNYWLNVILLKDRQERDSFLGFSNANGVQTRPVWKLLPTLPPYKKFLCTEIPVAKMLEDRIVNIPSSYRV